MFTIQTISVANPCFCSVHTGSFSPEVKQPRREAILRLHLTPGFTRVHDVVLNHAEGDLYLYHEQFTVRYARTNVIGSRTSFVIASVRSSIH